jgi:hypothetical protein
MKILFRAYFHQKNFQKKVGRKFIRVKIRIRNWIRIRIRTFSKVGSGSGSGQKSSGSATLLAINSLEVLSKSNFNYYTALASEK